MTVCNDFSHRLVIRQMTDEILRQVVVDPQFHAVLQALGVGRLTGNGAAELANDLRPPFERAIERLLQNPGQAESP